MGSRFYMAAFAFTAIAVTGNAQPRRAVITGGGDHGKCTIEVVVDGTAEVEVRGDTATLRNVAGQPPEWRRFQCNTVMPPDPVNFRFSGIDGRGRQELVASPRGGRPAVVRIDDPQGGREGYTFDLEWSYAGAPVPVPGPPPVVGRDGDRRDYGRDRRFTA